jgi:hypothetical protein
MRKWVRGCPSHCRGIIVLQFDIAANTIAKIKTCNGILAATAQAIVGRMSIFSVNCETELLRE